MKQNPDVSRDPQSAHSPFDSVWGEEHTCTAALHNTQLCCDWQPHFLTQQQINASSQSAALPPWFFFTFTFHSKHRVNSLLWQRQQGWILSRVVILRFIYCWHICLQLQLCCLSACLSLLMAVEPRHCRAFQQDGLVIISCHTWERASHDFSISVSTVPVSGRQSFYSSLLFSGCFKGLFHLESFVSHWWWKVLLWTALAKSRWVWAGKPRRKDGKFGGSHTFRFFESCLGPCSQLELISESAVIYHQNR